MSENIEEKGWLIEWSGVLKNPAEGESIFIGPISWLCVVDVPQGCGKKRFGYTKDSNKAIRFSRKEDAEAVLALHLGASTSAIYRDPFSVTEHIWHSGVVKS